MTNRDRSRRCRSCRPQTRRPNEVFVIVIVLSLEPKTTTAPRTQNKRSADRSADHVGVRALWRWRDGARTSLNDRSTYDGHFLALFWHKKWRDSNWKPLVTQLSTWPLLIRSSGNVEGSYSDRAMVCSYELE
jgi:hypothetical protein